MTTSTPHSKKPAQSLARPAGVVPTSEEKNMTMLQPAPDTVEADTNIAMCNTCGTTRTTRMKGDRPRLRCATCGHATGHGLPFLRPDDDWREEINDRVKPKLDVEAKLDVLEALGVEIEEQDERVLDDGMRPIADLQWCLDDGTLRLYLYGRHPGLSRTLDTALDMAADPTKALWFVFADRTAVGVRWSRTDGSVS